VSMEKPDAKVGRIKAVLKGMSRKWTRENILLWPQSHNQSQNANSDCPVDQYQNNSGTIIHSGNVDEPDDLHFKIQYQNTQFALGVFLL
jgi:hypothetical protein